MGGFLLLHSAQSWGVQKMSAFYVKIGEVKDDAIIREVWEEAQPCQPSAEPGL